MKFSAKQLQAVSAREDENYIDGIVREAEADTRFELKDPATLKTRLTGALQYARQIHLDEPNLLHSFLYMEACQPGLTSSPAIRRALEETDDPNQRWRDMMNAAVNLAKRKS
ncbi:hypothetical protein [Enterobacter cloacae complex sp. ESBL7]|uniref:hypothetical protein n=1 Tax=Enterobacter cloacae complex sp. ESBL7 TaxID=3163325 RepID=UPI003562E8BE